MASLHGNALWPDHAARWGQHLAPAMAVTATPAWPRPIPLPPRAHPEYGGRSHVRRGADYNVAADCEMEDVLH